MKPILIPVLAMLFCVIGCARSEAPSTVQSETTVSPGPQAGCQGCHPLTLDVAHRLACPECHGGQDQASEQDQAHTGLLARPAHPRHMVTTCGRCHPEIVSRAARSLHFTLAREVNLVRQAFGASTPLASLTEIPASPTPETPLELADDLLRRRCLACHVHAPGETFPATQHGTGCAACHLDLVGGTLAGHGFLARPQDRQCLACHYGNRVGSDYYGRFEHDYHWDYRTPFGPQAEAPDYGVPLHTLAADLHQVAGLACIDCHGGDELMAGGRQVTCLDCHGQTLGPVAALGVEEGGEGSDRRMSLRSSGRQLAVPRLANPAHQRHGDRVGCQVCHAQWAFTDRGNHLLRLDQTDYQDWEAVSRQGSRFLEVELERGLYGADGQEVGPSMPDLIDGDLLAGVWLQAFESRRWEEVPTCLDHQGMLQVCRPILDLSLSYVNAEGRLVIDAVRPAAGPAAGMLPYTPHTTGRAGEFYWQRLSGLRPTP